MPGRTTTVLACRAFALGDADHGVRESHRRGTGAAVVRFDRAQAANALSRGLMQDIIDCSEAFHDDAETRVLVFTGNGRHFCAGADLSEQRAIGATRLEARRNGLGWWSVVGRKHSTAELALGLPGRGHAGRRRAGRGPRPRRGMREQTAAGIADDQAERQCGERRVDRAIMHMDQDQWSVTAASDDFAEGMRASRRPR